MYILTYSVIHKIRYLLKEDSYESLIMFEEGRIMVKKGIFGALIIAALVFSGCASAPVAKQVYPSGTELYPAVYGTFAEMFPRATYASIDFYNNSYTLTGITGYAILIPITYDMTVRLSSSGEIEISYANIYEQDPKTRVWSKANAFGLYDYKKVFSDVTSKMMAIANDPAAFERAEKAAMADIVFVYTIMEKLTDLAFNDFIQKYAKGSTFVLEGPVSDVKEYGRAVNGITYNYLVTMNKNLVQDDALLSIMTGRTIYCRFYTNRDDVIRLSKTSVIKVSAALVSASRGAIGSGLVLDLAASE